MPIVSNSCSCSVDKSTCLNYLIHNNFLYKTHAEIIQILKKQYTFLTNVILNSQLCRADTKMGQRMAEDHQRIPTRPHMQLMINSTIGHSLTLIMPSVMRFQCWAGWLQIGVSGDRGIRRRCRRHRM